VTLYRTQIYLTAEQRAKLDALRRRDGRSMADHVRAAVDAYVAEEMVDVDEALDATFGSITDMTIPSREAWDDR
jgi:predicted DNA-binding protein